jgi:hypothetical protein
MHIDNFINQLVFDLIIVRTDIILIIRFCHFQYLFRYDFY